MINRNLNAVDRVLRFALAFWWLGPWAPHYDPAWGNFLIALIGWIALIESFLGWCWLHRWLGTDGKNH